jgi:hypothetical protein
MHHNLSLTLPLSNIDQETTGSIPTLPCPPAPLPTQPTPHRLPTTSERAPHEPLSPHTHQTQYSGRIRVRILSNRPIYGHAMLEGPLTWTQPIDHTGLITAENLPDGDYSITVRVEHHARLRFHFTITHGSLIDLGDIPIPKESRLELITPPLTQFDSATASLFALPTSAPPVPTPRILVFDSTGHATLTQLTSGSFIIRPRTMLLKTIPLDQVPPRPTAKKRILIPQLIHLHAGRTTTLTANRIPAIAIDIRPPAPKNSTWRISATTDSGIPYWTHTYASKALLRAWLPIGTSYILIIDSSGDTLLRQPIRIALPPLKTTFSLHIPDR